MYPFLTRFTKPRIDLIETVMGNKGGDHGTQWKLELIRYKHFKQIKKLIKITTKTRNLNNHLLFYYKCIEILNKCILGVMGMSREGVMTRQESQDSSK